MSYRRRTLWSIRAGVLMWLGGVVMLPLVWATRDVMRVLLGT